MTVIYLLEKQKSKNFPFSKECKHIYPIVGVRIKHVWTYACIIIKAGVHINLKGFWWIMVQNEVGICGYQRSSKSSLS